MKAINSPEFNLGEALPENQCTPSLDARIAQAFDSIMLAKEYLTELRSALIGSSTLPAQPLPYQTNSPMNVEPSFYSVNDLKLQSIDYIAESMRQDIKDIHAKLLG